MGLNPMNLIQLLKGGMNPQQLALNIIQQNRNNNPILQNALNLAQNGNTSGLMNLAKNLMAQRGLDFNKEFSDFKNLIG